MRYQDDQFKMSGVVTVSKSLQYCKSLLTLLLALAGLLGIGSAVAQTVTLTTSPTSIGEEDSATAVTVTATLSAAQTSATTITLSLAGTASSPADYSVSGTQSISIAANATTGSTTLTITPVEDTVGEGDETIIIQGTATGLTVSSATVTLKDYRVDFRLKPTPSLIGENAGTVTVSVSYSLTGPRSVATTFSAPTIGRSTDSADADDYTASAVTPASITIPAGSTTTTTKFSFTLTVTDDSLYEYDSLFTDWELISIDGSHADLGVSATGVFIDDNEARPKVALSASPASIGEGDSATATTVTATFSGPSRQRASTVTLSLAGTASSADYSESGTKSFTVAGDATTGSTTLTITPIEDTLVEGDESIDIKGRTSDRLSVSGTTVTLVDNEPPPDVTLTASPATIGESDSATAVTVTATLSTARANPTTIALSLAGTASSADYSESGTKSISIAANATTGSTTLTITPTEDTETEGTEEIVFEGTVDPATGLDVPDATVGLLDVAFSRTPDVTLTASPTSISEGDSATAVTVTATLLTARADATTIALSLGGTAGSADYSESGTKSISIAANATSGSTTLTITPTGDTLVEGDETIVIQGTGTGTAADLDVSDATVTLTDSGVTLTISPTKVTEGDGKTEVNVTVTLAAAVVADTEVTVSLGGGTATTADYKTDSPQSITLTQGSTSGTVVLMVEPVDDELIEEEETIIVSCLLGGGVRLEGELALQDNDSDTSTGPAVTGAAAPAPGPLANLLGVVAQNMLASTRNSVSMRFADGAAETRLNLGGMEVLPLLAQAPTSEEPTAVEGEPLEPAMSVDTLVRESALELVLTGEAAEADAAGAGSGAAWTMWAAGDYRRFAGEWKWDISSYEGALQSGYLGLDASGDNWRAGLALSSSGSATQYRYSGERSSGSGRLETQLTSVLPYLYWSENGHEVWAILGLGSGEVRNARTGDLVLKEQSSLNMTLAQGGGRLSLYAASGLDLGLEADVGTVRLWTGNGVQMIDGLAVGVWQARFGLDGAYDLALAEGVVLAPYGKVSGRYDGGDGETGVGLEVAGGLRLQAPRWRVEVQGRLLALHTAAAYKEYGVLVSVGLLPREDGSGLSLEVTPSWGAQAAHTDTLWGDEALASVGARAGAEAAVSEKMMMNARAGYGLVLGQGMVLTPFGAVSLSGSEVQQVDAGVRLDPTPGQSGGLSLELVGQRTHRAAGAAPEDRLMISGSLHW